MFLHVCFGFTNLRATLPSEIQHQIEKTAETEHYVSKRKVFSGSMVTFACWVTQLWVRQRWPLGPFCKSFQQMRPETLCLQPGSPTMVGFILQRFYRVDRLYALCIITFISLIFRSGIGYGPPNENEWDINHKWDRMSKDVLPSYLLRKALYSDIGSGCS